MSVLCLQSIPSENENCLQLQHVATSSPTEDISDILSALSPGESLVFAIENDAKDRPPFQVYRSTFQNKEIRIQDISNLTGNGTPFFWRQIPFNRVRFGSDNYYHGEAASHLLQGFMLLTSEGHLFELNFYPLARKRGFNLIYSGSLPEIRYVNQQLEGLGDFLLGYSEPDAQQKEKARVRKTADVNDMTCGPMPQQEPYKNLAQVCDDLGFCTPSSIPLLYDPKGIEPLTPFAFYYHGDPLFFSEKFDFTGNFISLGKQFFNKTDVRQKTILAHELGHYWYYREVGILKGETLVHDVWNQLPDPNFKSPNVLNYLAFDTIYAESEIYANLVALEWIHRALGESGKGLDQKEVLLARTLYYLNKMQSEWPFPIAAITLTSLIEYFSTDPLMSPSTLELGCSLFKNALEKPLYQEIQNITEKADWTTAEKAAGVQAYSCLE